MLKKGGAIHKRRS